MDEIQKLDLKTKDIVEENIEKLATLFPNCVTEGADGKVIDFDLLKQELSRQVVEGNKERYRIEWPGKKEAIVTANLPTTKTLRPVRKDSVDFDSTENIYIEGDNLEVLKLLQESYLGKIKMIYIDPPYNTGNDFIYKDNFARDTREELLESGQKDEDNNRLFVNSETSGRYHSDWLSMMYPRLKLARNLMTNDGVIFISIDDNEVHNLRKICDEIFGENNFLSNIIWEKRFTRSNNSKTFATLTEHILCFRKSDALSEIKEPRNEKADSTYSNPDNDPRGVWTSVSYVNPATKEQRPNLSYELINPITGEKITHPTNAWKYEKSTYTKHQEENKLYWGKDGKNTYPRLKRFLFEMDGGMVPVNFWTRQETGTTDEASKSLELLMSGKVFDFPKPIGLIMKAIKMGMTEDDIILDYYSGSGTTANAIMQLNADDGAKRKYILVQIPEITIDKSEAFKAGYKNICEIGKERIRRASKKIKEEKIQKAKNDGLFADFKDNQDYGFRVFRLSDRSFVKEIAKAKALRIVFKDSSFKDDTAKSNVKQLLKQLSPNTEMKVI